MRLKIRQIFDEALKKSMACEDMMERPYMLRYITVNGASSCCTRHFEFDTHGSFLSLDRWVPAANPNQANVLVLCGPVSEKAEKVVRDMYEQLLSPAYVICLGSCVAESGFGKAQKNGKDAESIIDLYVPGCPVSKEGVQSAIADFIKQADGKSKISN